MEHVVRTPVAGTLTRLAVEVGALVSDGLPLAFVEAGEEDRGAPGAAAEDDIDRIRPDLEELLARRELLTDAGRPDVVRRRHESGRRTARENIDDLCDPGELHRVRRFRHRRPTSPAPGGGVDRTDPGGRPGGRDGAGQRQPLRRRAGPVRRRVLRLHRAGRHAGTTEPPQEGPPVRAGRSPPPPGGPVRRGWRRAARGHRLRRRHRPRHAGVRPVRQTQRIGAAGRDRLRAVLRRERRPPRLL